ncbi:hypothetical protein NQ317_008799, partial [Molorchus minor]
MGKIPSVVASYLKLPDVACYTGHCLRRSSATLLADAGVDITTITVIVRRNDELVFNCLLNVIIVKHFSKILSTSVNPATPRERRVQTHLELAELMKINSENMQACFQIYDLPYFGDPIFQTCYKRFRT